MNHRLILAAIAVSAVACSDATAPSSQLRPSRPAAIADGTTTVPQVLETINPCNGDAVTLTGTLTTTTRTNISASGNENIFFNMSGSYSGFGAPSGVRYTARTDNKEVFHSNGTYPLVDEMSSEFRVISATSVDNFTVRVHYQVTFNAKGDATVDKMSIEGGCKG